MVDFLLHVEFIHRENFCGKSFLKMTENGIKIQKSKLKIEKLKRVDS
jgi:hypothetical protein